MVDIYGFHVGRYTIPMDPSWGKLHQLQPSNFNFGFTMAVRTVLGWEQCSLNTNRLSLGDDWDELARFYGDYNNKAYLVRY